MLTTRDTRQRYLLTLFTLACLGFVSACATTGGTGPRVVVMPIAGSSSASSAVNEVVNRRYQLVSNEKYQRAASRLDADTSDSRDVRRISRKLDIAAVVEGEVVKRGRKDYELRLVLRAGESGKEFDEITVKLKSKKLKKDDLRRVRKKLYSALAVVETRERDGRRSGSGSSRREMDRARKLRSRKHDKSRRDEERKDAKREEKRRRKEKKLARDDDDDDDERSRKRSKKSKKSKKKSKKSRTKVVTHRDDEGQAIDDEDPF